MLKILALALTGIGFATSASATFWGHPGTSAEDAPEAPKLVRYLHSPAIELNDGNYVPEVLIEETYDSLVIFRVYKTGRAVEVSALRRDEDSVRISKVVFFNKCTGLNVPDPINRDEEMIVYLDTRNPDYKLLGYAKPGERKLVFFKSDPKTLTMANPLTAPDDKTLKRILNIPLCK